MWLPYRDAFEIAAVVLAVALVGRLSRNPRVRAARIALRELAIVLVLYGVWQYVRDRAVTKSAGAMENALALWDVERRMHLPSEVALQRLFIDNRPAMWTFNVYYGGAHVPAACALLIWVFFWHRSRYAAVRATFALTIAGCIAIQALVPMAPPRFLTNLGFVDAALKYNMSVYGTGGHGISNEVAAMPSLHWAWALLVGVVVWTSAGSRWRWLGPVHVVMTAAAVTVTANHWWLDGAVAAVVVGAAFLVQHVVRLPWARRSPSTRAQAVAPGADAVASPAVRPLSNA